MNSINLSKLAPALALLAVLPGSAPASDRHADKLVATVVSLATEMARNATEMHPERNARFIPDTGKVVYVSFGSPITGKDYLNTLAESYSKRSSQSLVWDKWEVTPICDNAAVFTGWATMTEVSKAGEKKTQRAIFTEVFAKSADGWKRIIAQKSLLDES
jgi:hypothetical protein